MISEKNWLQVILITDYDYSMPDKRRSYDRHNKKLLNIKSLVVNQF